MTAPIVQRLGVVVLRMVPATKVKEIVRETANVQGIFCVVTIIASRRFPRPKQDGGQDMIVVLVSI